MNVVLGLALIAVLTVGVLFMINGVGFFASSMRPRVADDPEVIAGLLASVTSAIGSAAKGAVAYTLDGTRYEVAATSLDGAPIQAGAEVVIGHIENGTAVVERWEAVEGRI